MISRVVDWKKQDLWVFSPLNFRSSEIGTCTCIVFAFRIASSNRLFGYSYLQNIFSFFIWDYCTNPSGHIKRNAAFPMWRMTEIKKKALMTVNIIVREIGKNVGICLNYKYVQNGELFIICICCDLNVFIQFI